MAGHEANSDEPWLNRLRVAGWSLAGLLLLLPAVAMQFTPEVQWTAFDFIVAAAMLGGLGLGIEVAVRASRDLAYRLAAAIGLGLCFLIFWITGAAGIIGSEREDSNLLFLALIPVFLIGAAAARLRPGGMARTATLAAVLQALVPVVASLLGWDPLALIWAPEVIALTVIFTGLWLAAAWLFRQAAARQAAAA